MSCHTEWRAIFLTEEKEGEERRKEEQETLIIIQTLNCAAGRGIKQMYNVLHCTLNVSYLNIILSSAVLRGPAERSVRQLFGKKEKKTGSLTQYVHSAQLQVVSNPPVTVADLSLMCHSCRLFAWQGMSVCESLTGVKVVVQVRHVSRQTKLIDSKKSRLKGEIIEERPKPLQRTKFLNLNQLIVSVS